ncbi:MAG: uracil-DNA glycosylase family protein [Gammaproteobacteria bacterium]
MELVPNSKNSVVDIARRLGRDAGRLEFATPSHVYNPLQYAWTAHHAYLEQFGNGVGRVLLLGMNPGPWGMAQTGVPFGDVVMAREWLGIEASLGSPLPAQHPKYPIMGFDCHRREGSGSRLWGWARERFEKPERFFERFFVWNYCPLLFIGDGRNMTPEKLRRAEADALTTVCNAALRSLLNSMGPVAVVGIGRYAERRAREVALDGVPVGYLPHPSPASPAANRDWPALAESALAPWLAKGK